MQLTPHRRRALSTFLAIVLAAESVSAVAAAGVTVRSRLAESASTGAAASTASAGAAASTAGVVHHATLVATAEIRRLVVRAEANAAWVAADIGPGNEAGPRDAQAAAAARARDQAADQHMFRATSKDKVSARDKSPSKARATTKRSGRNHVWIPSLGINRSVAWFPCDRKRPPDNYVYRWGCAGSNNVYLLGHAYSVFKPLHDAYVRGRLRTGMKAYYADARGRLHTYRVRWWKVTAPTTAASWAWAALRRPSMTLQTCVGKNSAYRLMVRLAEVG